MIRSILLRCALPAALRKVLRRLVSGVALLAAVAAGELRAQGAPPMITNDPGTAGPGGWEVNFGAGYERDATVSTGEIPVFEVKHGLGETLELSFRTAWLTMRERGAPRVSGPDNLSAGCKWRFHEGGERGVTAAVFPQLEFNAPGATSADRGLVERGTALTVPWLFQRTCGATTLWVEAGGVFRRRRADEWFAGIAAGRPVGRATTVGVELLGAVDRRFSHGTLLLNVGAAVDLTEKTSLLVAVGRELHHTGGERLTLVGYLGWQLRR